MRHAGPGATCLSEPRAGRSPGPLHGMPDIEVSSSAETDPVAGFKPGTKAKDGGKSGKHLVRGRPLAVSLHSQLAGSGEKHLPPASWQPAAPPRTAAALQGKRRSLEAQPYPGRDGETVAGGKTLPSHPFFSTYPCFVCVPGQTGSSSCGTHCWARGQLQAEQAGKRGQRGAYRPTPAGPQHGSGIHKGHGVQGVHVSVLLHPFCSRQVSNSCCKGEELQSQAS